LPKRAIEQIIIIALFFTTISHALSTEKITYTKSKTEAIMLLPINKTKYMSTEELQKEVEKLSLSGDMSFEMGLELIKRWTEG